jgi:hypothetical protein
MYNDTKLTLFLYYSKDKKKINSFNKDEKNIFLNNLNLILVRLKIGYQNY